jgi:flavin reductase (DIM6/NTAB) family NADH-FMN oxidoreductase RutF
MADIPWPTIEPQAFKAVMACWSSGVTIATTCYERAPVGMTVSSFTGVSLYPPQILICVNRQVHTHAAFAASDYFAVNLLAVEHLEWGMQFAGLRPEIVDRFQGIAWVTAQTGAPILPGVVGWFDCQRCHAFAIRDHTIFVGEVVACVVLAKGAPLLYHSRQWRQLAEESLQLESG